MKKDKKKDYLSLTFKDKLFIAFVCLVALALIFGIIFGLVFLLKTIGVGN